MKVKLLTNKDYFKYFNILKDGTGCGIEKETETRENFLWAQTFLPKDFFEVAEPSPFSSEFLRRHLVYIPNQVHVKFELFGIGRIDDVETFIFKPWVLNVDIPALYQYLENFHLYVPSLLFYNLIENMIFLDQLNQNDFKHIRVLQDISTDTFKKFGLDKSNVPKIINVGNLEILKLDEIDKLEITKFYTENWESLTPRLENMYFRPSLNTWFRITSEELNRHFFSFKQSIVKKTVGFIRLYNTNSKFTGGFSLEYIIDKAFRKRGYATRATLSIIDYLKNYSNAISISAQVNDNNDYSKKVLHSLRFSETDTGPFDSDNYYLSLLDNLIILEEKYNAGKTEVRVLNKYAIKYREYFL